MYSLLFYFQLFLVTMLENLPVRDIFLSVSTYCLQQTSSSLERHPMYPLMRTSSAIVWYHLQKSPHRFLEHEELGFKNLYYVACTPKIGHSHWYYVARTPKIEHSNLIGKLFLFTCLESRDSCEYSTKFVVFLVILYVYDKNTSALSGIESKIKTFSLKKMPFS